MARTGSNIYKRKDGRWEGRYRKGRNEKGKIIYGYVFAKTLSDVKERLSTKQGVIPTEDISSTTMSKIAEQWLFKKHITVKKSTYVGYESIIKLHILPYFGDMSIENLTTDLIHSFTQIKLNNGRINEDKGLSSTTVRGILTILKGIIDFAVDESLIEKPIRITFPSEQRKEMRVLTRLEQEALQKVLLEDITIYKIGILLCLYTGLRVGEVCGLRCEDFSPEADKVCVCRTLRRVTDKDGSKKTKLMTSSPKSKSSIREIPIPKFLSILLQEFIHDTDTYFLASEEREFTEPRTIQNHFKRLVKLAGISEVNFHCLRHTFSTRCIEANIDIKTISEMLGHSSVSFTLNRYVHSSFDQKRESMNKLEQYMDV